MEDYKGLGSQKPLPLFSSQHLIWSLSVTFSGGGGVLKPKNLAQMRGSMDITSWSHKFYFHNFELVAVDVLKGFSLIMVNVTCELFCGSARVAFLSFIKYCSLNCWKKLYGTGFQTLKQVRAHPRDIKMCL